METAAELYKKMCTAYESENYIAAVKCAEELLHRDDVTKDALEAIVAMYVDNRQHERAKAALARLSKKFGKDGNWYFFAARVEHLQKHHPQAIKLAERALKLELTPYRRLMTHNILARLHKDLGLIERATKESITAVCVQNTGNDTEEMLRLRRDEYANYLLDLHYTAASRDKLFAAACRYPAFLPRITPFSHRKRRHQKIRVAYISHDLRRHVVMDFAWAFFSAYDRSRFEVYAYFSGKEDETSRRIAANIRKWTNVTDLTLAETAQRIFADEIDILVDLAGHTSRSLLPVLAYKPAPVQISGIGYFDTTGLPAVDYFLADNYTDPPGLNDEFFTEKLLRLPHSHWCYTPRETGELPAFPPPYRQNGYITFGSFNNFPKINDTVLGAWAEILRQVPHSRLFLRTHIFGIEYGIKLVKQRLKAAGIPLERVITEKFADDYLVRYNEIDIALDSFPYPGGGTTCDALYMGVPVVTLIGERHNSRFGFSILSNIGLPELAADTVADYIKTAVALANDPPRLSRLHQTLRRKMRQSPLMNVNLYMTELENIYSRIAAPWLDNDEYSPHAVSSDFTDSGKKYLAVAIAEKSVIAASRAAYFLQKTVTGETLPTAENFRLLAEAYEHCGKFSAEHTALSKALKLYEQTSLPDNAVMRQILCRLAYTALYMGKAQDAAIYYRRAAQFADTLMTRAELYGAMLLTIQNTDIASDKLFNMHRDFQKLFADVTEYTHEHHAPIKGRRLKIGYVSPDFRRHVLFAFYYGILVCHNRRDFEIYCYYTGTVDDGFTAKVRETAEHFCVAGMMSAEQLSDTIYADGIDVLVDLAGHSANNALCTFARKPAPVQISALGYIATTGLKAMDYFLTDRITDPPGNEKFLTETPLYLPSQFCYAARSDAPEPTAPPCLDKHFVTFGVFNRYAKITDEMLAAWHEIMRRVPHSRLIIKSTAMNDDETAALAYTRLKTMGFDMDYVSFEPATEDYLSRYQAIDIALDTYPYTGGGTTFDALYMGVPVITRFGTRRNTRFGLSVLTNIGLKELAAADLRSYVETAVALASDRELLSALYGKAMRRRLMTAAPLTPQSYTREWENCLSRIAAKILQ